MSYLLPKSHQKEHFWEANNELFIWFDNPSMPCTKSSATIRCRAFLF